jgi:ParB family transcriptional regulator, chromosome partitioning protein
LSSISTLRPDQIHVSENVRALDTEHVQALKASIALQGMLVPLVVCPADSGAADGGAEFDLVAGFHRYAAAVELGLAEIPAVLRAAGCEAADRAVENVARKQLTPQEEAIAVRAMLQRGLTEDGAAQALGWSRARVTARMKLLELPEQAQQLVGSGVVALGAVEQLRAIGKVSPGLLDAVVQFIADGNAWAAERLAREPGGCWTRRFATVTARCSPRT